jgi:hypothetical protein
MTVGSNSFAALRMTVGSNSFAAPGMARYEAAEDRRRSLGQHLHLVDGAVAEDAFAAQGVRHQRADRDAGQLSDRYGMGAEYSERLAVISGREEAQLSARDG